MKIIISCNPIYISYLLAVRCLTPVLWCITTGTDMNDLPASVSQLRLWLKIFSFDGIICLKWMTASFELPLTLSLSSHRGLVACWNKARASPSLPNKEGRRYKETRGSGMQLIPVSSTLSIYSCLLQINIWVILDVSFLHRHQSVWSDTGKIQ